ncbi:MAG: hypothetical protein LUC43_01980 [Burkholderiales bacterium]|nr:hypothetical protein [Burkholderiales bacterium]
MQNIPIVVKEVNSELSIPFHACILYHGYDSIGGLSLGFRLLQWGLEYLSDGSEVPSRDDITFKTAFPGPGVRDAVEMVTRAVSRHRYEILAVKDAPDFAPEGVYGKMYFEIGLKGRVVKVALKPGVLPQDFIEMGRLVKSGNTSFEVLDQWEKLKHRLHEDIWKVKDFGSVLTIINPKS